MSIYLSSRDWVQTLSLDGSFYFTQKVGQKGHAEPPHKAVTTVASDEGSTWVGAIEKQQTAIFTKTSKKPALKPCENSKTAKGSYNFIG